MQRKIYTTDFGGKTLTAEFNDLTTHANGSVMLTYGETVVLVTAVMGKANNPNLPYFPLSVEFEEKFYAAGAILGSRYGRREGRPSDEAILSARIVDRTIRPLFDHSIRREIQVVISVLAMGEDDPDVLAVIGSSLALHVSDIPFAGPVGAIRVARNREDKRLLINPTYRERTGENLETEVLACGKDGTLNMIETQANETSEAELMTLLKATTEYHTALTNWQESIRAEIGKAKYVFEKPILPEVLITLYKERFANRLFETIFSGTPGKAHIYQIKTAFVEAATTATVDPTIAGDFFETKIDEVLHEGALLEQRRADGRGLDEVRDLYAKAGGLSPVLHGSGIFYRGGTHIFSALTLGGPEAAQLIDSIETKETKKRFMHHYNFPPFSVGETGRVGGFNRRMIGHGALAEKALLPVLPPKDVFPYTIRLVSETLASNGSSSMGSVCASSLALMDGGVPITRAVAGIASGVMMGNDTYTLLTDIQGPEDEFGDMDFKVAGTFVGITAVQMDVKVSGIPLAILGEALDKARLARLHILKTMDAVIPSPRTHISPRAPEIISLSIKPDQIGLVIGGGGKTINKIKDQSGVEEITIEDDGAVYITGRDGSAHTAATMIAALTKIYEVGEVVDVTVSRLSPFGVFVTLDAHHEGLIHISEITPFHLSTVEGIFSIGETLRAVVSKVENGKIGLSIKRLDPEFAIRRGIKPTETPAIPNDER